MGYSVDLKSEQAEQIIKEKYESNDSIHKITMKERVTKIRTIVEWTMLILCLYGLVSLVKDLCALII
jgi:hypothetical protein